MKKQFSIALAVVAATQLGATDCGQVLKDPGFDLWCGETLCSWKLTRGEIQRVGTWHSSDSGVSFLGAESAIQQTSPVNSNDGTCITFSMVANVNAGVDMFLEVDVDADGTVERRERIPASNWAPVRLYLLIAPPYDGIRFELVKTGTGEAVLANMGAEIFEGSCQGIEPINAAPRETGSVCFSNGQCESGICSPSPTLSPAGGFGNVCVGCTNTGQCDSGEVCGIAADAASPIRAVPVDCVPMGVKQLAEQCIADAECASGVCAEINGNVGVCSSCDAAADCGGGACAQSWISPTFVAGPAVCRPGENAGVAGTGCGTDADCASGTCAGSERKQCDDGRACNSPADCPSDGGLEPGPCTTVGIQGGSCT